MDDDYRLKEQENLRNPKNRFLGIFCHAKDVDTSWGCDWSFGTGVVIFSIVILVASFADAYTMAEREVFKKAPNGLYSFFFGLKVLEDIVNFSVIIIACFGVYRENLKLSIISYWGSVCSFLLNTLFFIYIFIAMFYFWDKIWPEIPSTIVLEIGLVLFSWILFCNQVDVGRKKRSAVATSNY